MSMINQFLWVIFPYICLAVFIVGHIYRYRTDQFNWTAKSSEFIEKKHLKLGSLMFHLGIIPVIGGTSQAWPSLNPGWSHWASVIICTTSGRCISEAHLAF